MTNTKYLFNIFKATLIVLLTVIGLLSIPSKVQATKNDDSEELSYDQLLQELHQQKSQIIDDSISTFDAIKIHAGLGYVNSFSQFFVNDTTLERYQNAIQLSLGVDLFSHNWFSEGAFRNYGLTQRGSESIYLKQLDLKIGYKDVIQGPWSFFLTTGLSTRYLDYTDTTKGISISNTTPSLMGSLGILAQLNPNLNFSVETTGRGALIRNTADRSSIDFLMKLETYF